MNVLILSAGSRGKLVSYFQRALAGRGNVVTTDSSELAPTLYLADRHYVVPRITDPDYLPTILDICRRESIDTCLSLIDPELALLADHADEFRAVGVTPMISPAEAVHRGFNKWDMYRFCVDNGIPTPRTWADAATLRADLEAGVVALPLFAKPATGSASANIRTVTDAAELAEAWALAPDMIVQELMTGEAIDVDVYIDLITGEVISLFAKKKLRMRAGTADKSVSFKDPALDRFVIDFCRVAGFRGAIDIDLFVTDDGYSLLEVNPRFGGVYPHAYECGVDFPSMLLRNVAGEANEPNIGAYEEDWAMLAYEEVVMTRIEGLSRN
ncbi:ATP-grasp domain-containing protein [Tessaracoccus defluvii]|uniref:ATP-grasp domain-containing protein n=1 Tax=Tessaracoccus defluvii TaxID=1285901 RepID=UPI001D0489A6|nr:ATP-grasp domain-containing protein [Tessaracoccus defluvii]